MKSRKIVVYITKKDGSIFVHPTKEKNHKFSLLTTPKGKALSPRVSDTKLGKTIREVLCECE